MKNKFLLLCLIALIFSAGVQAQQTGRLTVSSEDGDKFFMLLNGERQNSVAQTGIRVEDLKHPEYSVKLIFEDRALGEISKTIFMAAPSGSLMDVSYKIKRQDGKPQWGAVPISSAPVEQGYVAPDRTYVVHYGNPPSAAAQAAVNVAGMNMQVSVREAPQQTPAATAYRPSKRPIYYPCFLMDSADKHLEFIKMNATRIFIDSFDCRQMLLDSIAVLYTRTKNKKYLDALTFVRNSSAAGKVESLYTDVIRILMQSDFPDLLNQLYAGKGKYLALEKELIAAMNMIVDGRPYKQKYMGLLNVAIAKAKDKKDAAQLAWLEKLKVRIEEDDY